jgi:hypothetical protein
MRGFQTLCTRWALRSAPVIAYDPFRTAVAEDLSVFPQLAQSVDFVYR